jgi:zona occludens toxin
MSITLWSGLPGSGKSYGVTRDVLVPAIQSGRTVYTNIPLHDDLWIAEFGYAPVHFETKDVIDNKNWFLEVLPSGAVLVLDECWRLWPAGLKANNVEGSHKEFLAEHRHRVGEDGRSTEIILVTQDAGQLSAFARQLIEKTYRCKKLDSVGRDKNFRIDIYEGAVTGANPPRDKRLREMFGEYKPEIYRLYKSHTKSETGEAGNEKKVDDSANIFKGGKFKSMLAAMVILPILAVFLGWRAYSGMHKATTEKAEASQAAVTGSDKSMRELAAVRAQQESGFLHGRKIAISAVANYGEGVEYRFKVKDGDGVARFSQMELIGMGYRVEPVSECVVKISGHQETLYAMCVEEQSPGVVAQAFQVPKENQSL